MTKNTSTNSNELANIPPDWPQPQIDVLLVQGGVAVAVNLSLAFVIWALATLVKACKTPAQ